MDAPGTPPPVGHEDPLPPEHSLPSYHEPTPETHRPISREEEAELALTRTEFTPGAKWLLTTLFLVTVASLPLINLAARLRHEAHGHAAPGAEVLGLLPRFSEINQARTWADWMGLLPTSAEIKSAEKNLEKESIVTQFLLPRVQSVLTGTLHAGNEQAYPGRDGWLFYRPDVDYITGPPFLAIARLKQRARDLGIQPDPVKAIVDFKDQLAARGIKLLLVPIPAKAGIEAQGFIPFQGNLEPLKNPALGDFRKMLNAAGVAAFDFDSLLETVRAEDEEPWAITPLYLRADTHWLPRTMQMSAERISRFIEPRSTEASRSRYNLTSRAVKALGDTALLLNLPLEQAIYHPQAVTVQQVEEGNALWRPDPASDVLLLGDSFSNIYSLAAMGWGESAGLAEHISYALGRPIDCILRNSDGAFATREILSRELARGRDRLAGKKYVIWEFAERELMFGNWKLLPMALGQPAPAKFFSTPPAGGVVVTATVAALSSVPRPGTVPYKDHVFSVHLEEIEGAAAGEKAQAVAFLWSMRENSWTPAARWRPGDRVKLRLTPWLGTEDKRSSFNRSEFDDPALQLEEPVWAELAE